MVLFESFEEIGVQKSILQDYFTRSQIAGKSDYAKIFHGKYSGSLKIMPNEDLEIPL